MKDKIYTAAVIGTGRIGFSLGFDKKREQPASHTFALLDNKRVKIIAGCDKNPENLAAWQSYVKQKNGPVQIFNDTTSLFENCKPDIVVIAVNEDSHLQCSLDVIAKKPRLIILEKPVALNVADGQKIVQAATENNVPILVNHERRFASDYAFAKKYMQKIGEIMSVSARLDSGLRVYCDDAESNGEYSLLHDGTHLVDIVSSLLEDDENSKQAENNQNVLKNMKITSIFYDKENPRVVRNVSVHFESEKCPDVSLNISGRSRFFGFEIDIIGREGRIRIGNGIHEYFVRKESKLYTGFWSLAKDKTVPRAQITARKTGYFSNMLQNGIDFLDGKAQLRSTLQTGMNALKILEEIKNELNRH